jgi:uncharacterized protein (DUF488 family)
MLTVYTIGHSNHEPDIFLRLLRLAKIEVLVDIRSSPNSTWVTFAKKQNLQELLKAGGIKYLYMGDVLGGQPSDPEYVDPQTGRIDYHLIQQNVSFQQGIKSVMNGCEKYRMCLMCAEENPAHCHRSLLVGDALIQNDVKVLHIRGDGRIQTDEELSKERAGVPTSQQRFPL